MDRIDLNSDLGESYGPWTMGDDDAVLGIVSSANVACGGHASDPETMLKTILAAVDGKVRIGAHPGFADKEGFGRRRIPLTARQMTTLVAAQVGALTGVAGLVGAEVGYVKIHGALANWAAAERWVAEAVLKGIVGAMSRPHVLAISGTALHHLAKEQGVPVFAEVFADRGYMPNGQLAPRGTPGSMIHDADEAAERMVQFLETGEMPTVEGGTVTLEAQSICVHGDGPEAVAIARTLKSKLTSAGVSLAPFC
ncbi:MAG: 5-oxoprolinase subunit PxpA [Pseudomonadota bacterium]